MKDILKKIAGDYVDVNFVETDKFYWSPREQTVFYKQTVDKTGTWALIHELAHGVLQHKTYHSDFELLQLEVAAWEAAKDIAKRYKVNISDDHIQDCLDTYRDWLHARSKCPACGDHGLQIDPNTYECLNCFSQWHVSTERFCRAYRKKLTKY